MARSNRKERLNTAILNHFYSRNPDIKKALSDFLAKQIVAVSMGELNQDEYIKEHGVE